MTKRTAQGSYHAKLLAAITLALVLVAGYLRISAYRAWRRELSKAGFESTLDVPGHGRRVLIFAPHPDDEVLGCGGLIQQAVREGAKVFVALMTNGDASELALIFGEKDLPLTPKAFIKLGKDRQRETLQALAKLGVPSDHVYFLGFPNNGLLKLWRPEYWSYATPYLSPQTKMMTSPYELSFTPHAPYCGQQVLSDLTALLQQIRPTDIFLAHPQDIHPDHWATCAFVCYALQGIRAHGAAWAQQARVYAYLIHWPHWPVPRSLAPRLQLLPPTALAAAADGKWLKLDLEPDEVKAKLRAIHTYRSQEPGFDRLLLAFARTNETFARLGERTLGAGGLLAWQDEVNRKRKLKGAETCALGTGAAGRLSPRSSSPAAPPAPYARTANSCRNCR